MTKQELIDEVVGEIKSEFEEVAAQHELTESELSDIASRLDSFLTEKIDEFEDNIDD